MKHGPYTEIQCGACGVWFCMSETAYTTKQREGGFFYCPNGHCRGWNEGTKKRDELRLERDRLKQRLSQRDDEIKAAKKSNSSLKGQITRIKNRTKNGVCPCCNRHFENLQRHMQGQHPDWDGETEAEETK